MESFMLDLDRLQKILEIPARFVDLTVQSSITTNIVLKDGVAKDLTSGRITGVGIRVLDKTWGFVSSNSIGGVEEMVDRASKIAARGNAKIEFFGSQGIEDRVGVKIKIDPSAVSMEEKVGLLKEAEQELKDYNEVVSSSFSYSDSSVRAYYMNSEGSLIESRYTKVGLFVSVFAKKDGRIQVGLERLGGTSGLEVLEDRRKVARGAAEKAIRLLDAEQAPAGRFKVVLDPKLTGVFMHEALGHAAEADHVIKGESILEGRLGERIGSELVTVYDDPTLEGSFGFYFYDSEGIKGRKKAIIEKGILKSYLHSRETSTQFAQESTGNGRAQAYNYQPIPRMSNTYLRQGKHAFDEMVEDMDNGIYLKGSKGGEVDTARGVFHFSAEEGFLIENGEITKPIRDVSLSGETLRILRDIDAVGNDFSMHTGFCGKASQFVPVGDGGPHIRTYASVGGTR